MRTASDQMKPDSYPQADAIDLHRVALLFDVDGTLLDIAPTPTEVVVPAMLTEMLGDLIGRAGGALALVSGRTIETLDRIFSPLVAPAIGGHGAEMRIAPGEPIVEISDAGLSTSLRHALHRLADIDAGVLIEDKGHSIALHYRLAPRHEVFLKAAVSEMVASEPSDSVEIVSGKHVIDIKSAHFNKGSAVCQLMERAPFAGRKPIFVGDDTTDESVFAILPDLKGRGYSVGRQVAGTQGTFASPDDVRAWLGEIWSRSGNGA
jgi:trehalose 6-phosphate phosphatase